MLETGLIDEVSKLGETLFGEVSRTAKETFEKSYMGKTKITRKALSPLKNIQQKLSDLSFIEPRVTPVASLISTALEKIPSRGLIHGTTLLMLQGLMGLLTSPDALTKYAQEILEGRTHESVLDCLVQPGIAKYVKKKEVKPEQSKLQLESLGLW